MNYDKSLIEVWNWQEKLYEETKDLSEKEFIEKINNEAEKVLLENNIQLKKISKNDFIIKRA